MERVQSLDEAYKVFNKKIVELGEKPFCEQEMRDLGLEGNETISEIEQVAKDIHSEMQSDRAEEKHRSSMGNYYD